MARGYSIALTGTTRRTAAIARAREGQAVTLVHEPDNPWDERAIAALGEGGEQLGYLPKDSWAADALIDEEKGCAAAIEAIALPARVILALRLEGPPIGTREFEAS